jgi:hypothetical protein
MRCTSIRRLLSGVAFGLFAVLGSAHADIIDFESLPADSLFGDGATFNQLTYYQFTQNGDFGLATSAASFAVAMPPTGNDTQFYSALNDTSVSFQRTDGIGFNISSFDAAYLSPFPQGEGVFAGRILLIATDADGQTLSSSWDFGASDSNGSYGFQSFNLGSGFSNLTSATFLACVYEGDGCIFQAQNAAQFAVDNIVVSPVPEPQAYAMMALGMLVVGFCCRPKRA